MASETIRALADMINTGDTGSAVEMLWATVTAAFTGPPKTLTIRVLGSATDIPGVRYDASYTSPAAGDVVFGRIVGTDYLVEGKLA